VVYKKCKSSPRNTGFIVQHKAVRFYGSPCIDNIVIRRRNATIGQLPQLTSADRHEASARTTYIYDICENASRIVGGPRERRQCHQLSWDLPFPCWVFRRGSKVTSFPCLTFLQKLPKSLPTF